MGLLQCCTGTVCCKKTVASCYKVQHERIKRDAVAVHMYLFQIPWDMFCPDMAKLDDI